jgi:hypothetical protein
MTYDRTKLRARFFDRERARKGPAGNLYFLKVGDNNALEKILEDGLSSGWMMRSSKDPHTGESTKYFEVMMIAPVTADICNQATAFQVNDQVFEKIAQTPDDGTEPRMWVYQVNLQHGATPIAL